MAKITVLACPVCGAPLGAESPRCEYCGSIVVIETDHPRFDPALLNKVVIDERMAGFRAALRADPRDERAHYGLGVAYFNLGLLEEAADELGQAARLMPENPHIQTQLGVIFADLGERGKRTALQSAWERMERALLLRPDLAEALLLKARLQQRRSDTGAAIETLREATRHDPVAAQPKLLAALLEAAHDNLKDQRWENAVNRWQEAAALDSQTVRAPLGRFLDANRAVLARSRFWSLTRPRSPQVGARETGRSRKVDFGRLTVSILLALLVVVASLVLMIVSAVQMPEENGEAQLKGAPAFIFFASLIGLVLGPICVLVIRWRSRPTQQNASSIVTPNRKTLLAVHRDELLTGQTAEVGILLDAARYVASVLEEKDRVQRMKAASRKH